MGTSHEDRYMYICGSILLNFTWRLIYVHMWQYLAELHMKTDICTYVAVSCWTSHEDWYRYICGSILLNFIWRPIYVHMWQYLAELHMKTDICTFVVVSCWTFLEWDMLQTEVVEKIRHFMFSNFFTKVYCFWVKSCWAGHIWRFNLAHVLCTLDN